MQFCLRLSLVSEVKLILPFLLPVIIELPEKHEPKAEAAFGKQGIVPGGRT